MTLHTPHMDALAQAEAVRSGAVSPLELVEATIQRIEAVNPQLNAVIAPMYDAARAAATGPLGDGPFAGVPFLLKDLVAEMAGVPFTEGSAFLRDHVSTSDSELVRRYKRAGLIIVARTTTPEFGILGTTEAHLFGPTRNPWDPGRSTGGSSGGAGAAVASGMVPMAHGNDGGGSIRIPASACGVFGLKPTRGRNPLGPHHGDIYSGLVAEHALTRSVRDSAALLDATAGPDVGDPYWAPPPGGSFLAATREEPRPLRIAFSTASPWGNPIHSDCIAAAHDAAALCAHLGHHVSEAAPPLDTESIARAFDVVWSAGIASVVEGWTRRTGRSPRADDLEPLTWAMVELGRSRTAPQYLAAIDDLQRIARGVAQFHTEYDVWLTPTLSSPPPEIGWISSTPDDPLRAYRRDTDFCPFPPVANFTGQPAMSVPLYWNGDGLPIGVHFLGRFGAEETLFRLAAQLEGARPWAGRRPPVWA